ncbi:MAG: hypothetical protein ACO3C1_13230 [Ilumatobacteraceae bacterium]
MTTHSGNGAPQPPPGGNSGDGGTRFWLDIRRRGPGWEFVVGATHTNEHHGWRPTKNWAKRAGKRRIRRLGG